MISLPEYSSAEPSPKTQAMKTVSPRSTVALDAAYDAKEIYDLIQKEYQAQAIIPLNRRNAKQPETGFDWDGTPVCSVGYRMVYWGSSESKNKFRCPHILGKCDCPSDPPGVRTATTGW